nr:class B sortase [uncultured Acetatifactor sp.]
MDKNRGNAPVDRWKVIAGICIAVAVAAGVALVCLLRDFYGEEMESETKMEELRGVSLEAEGAEETGEEGGEDTEAQPAEAPAATQKPLEKNPYGDLFARNGDMALWLTVDGTAIDYPAMQTPEDENYYLERDFDGNEDKAGCLILDTDSALYGENLTTNLIIHGHNMKAGTMFGGLMQYEDEGYAAEHKRMEVHTRTDKREYEVIAVFYSQVYYPTDTVFKYYNFFHADTEMEFNYFYDGIKELSLYDTGVTAKLGDHFLTLSTCSYQVEDGRFVVVAKEVGREEKYESPD